MTRKDFSESIAETIRLSSLEITEEGKERQAQSAAAKGPVDEKLVVFTDSRSLAAEYFHYLAVKVEGALPERGKQQGRVLLVTGPSRGSGKSLCSLNLSLALARTYPRQVLFLDADCRAGQAQRYLGYGEAPLPGLTDVLGMKQRAGSVLLDPGVFDLTFFPSGPFVENIFARTGDKEVPLLFESLRKKFALTIVDTPPAFPLPEAGILAAHADAVLVVLGAGRDGAPQLNQTLEALRGSNVIGVVLNDLPPNMEQQSRYGRYGRYYGYGEGTRRKAKEQG